MKNLMVLVTGVFAVYAPALGQPLPPPPTLEFFNPTSRTHLVKAKCQGASLEASWAFASQSAKIQRFVFAGRSAGADQMRLMNAWLKEIEGDVFVWVECGNDGAVVSFIQASLAGTGMAKQIKFTWIDGRATLFAKYRFPVK